MPLDANCPKCRHVFPITESRGTDRRFVPRLRDRTDRRVPPALHTRTRPAPLRAIRLGGPAGGRGRDRRSKKHRLPDDDESEMHRGGGMGIVVLAGVSALVLAVAGLGATGYLLFTNLDTSDSTINKLSSNDEPKRGTRRRQDPRGTRSSRGPDGRKARHAPAGRRLRSRDKFEPFEPPVEKKPNDTFDLKPVTGTHQEITPPPIDLKSPVTLKLPGPAEAVTVGGNGRYIIFHIPSTQQLTVFDASKGALVATEKVPEQFRLFLAGGQNRVVSCDLHSRILRSYTLPELRKEFDFTSPLFHHPEGIAMGSGVNSPLLISDPFANVALFDLTKERGHCRGGIEDRQTLWCLPAQSPNPRPRPAAMCSSSRGQTTGARAPAFSPWRGVSGRRTPWTSPPPPLGR